MPRPQHVTAIEISVPPFFLCPISLQLMRDPVTLSTGHTFDHSSIEKWLEEGHKTCPVTRQLLRSDEDPIPNHALRRMIQGWCVANKSNGIERIATPKHPVSAEEAKELVRGISEGSHDLETLKNLNRMARENTRSRKHLLEAGVLPGLASHVNVCVASSCRPSFSNECPSPRILDNVAETLSILTFLCENVCTKMYWNPTSEQISAISLILLHGNLDSKLNAAILLNSIELSAEMKKVVGGTDGLFDNLVQMIKHSLHPRTVRAGLQLLYNLLSLSRHRVKVVDVGAVEAVVELLAEANRKTAELGLSILETLCRCPEGRAAFYNHALSIPMTVQLIHCISDTATIKALKILNAMSSITASVGLTKAAIQTGALYRIMLVLQGSSSAEAKKQALGVFKSFGKIVDLNAGNLLCVRGKDFPHHLHLSVVGSGHT